MRSLSPHWFCPVLAVLLIAAASPTLRNRTSEWSSRQRRKMHREAIKKNAKGQASSHRLLGPDKSVENVRGVLIETNDDTARIYPGCIRRDGSGGVERRENSFT
jgi:hypothetical protein